MKTEKDEAGNTINSGDKKNCNAVKISGRVWCDDHVDVYLGSASKVGKKLLSADYNKAQSFEFGGTAKCCDYLYFVCWSNKNGKNGFMAEITGGTTIRTGDPDWLVLPTNNSSFSSASPRPAPGTVSSQIMLGANQWVSPFVGQQNDASNKPWGYTISGFSTAPHFIWHNSNNAPGADYPLAPYNPFDGFNHQEFLIFKLPIRKLHPRECSDCLCPKPCCGTCSGFKEFHQISLEAEASQKSFLVPGQNNDPGVCQPPYSDPSQGGECRAIDIPRIQPCFYFHWGDGPSDQIETHDTETVMITVCNPYQNVTMKGLTINSIQIVPGGGTGGNGEPRINIVPDKLITFDCLKACTCQSRQFTLLTRDVKEGNYNIHFDYCLEGLEVHGMEQGKNSFPIVIAQS